VHPRSAARAGAVEDFKKWFLKKTSNAWDQRHNFVQRPGQVGALGPRHAPALPVAAPRAHEPRRAQYGFVELSTVNKEVIIAEQSGKATAPCRLGPEVAELVEMLFDENTILNSMKA
jgi:hypothetical protein